MASESLEGSNRLGASEDDRHELARGGSFTMVGHAYSAFIGFGLTLVVGRYFGAHAAGLFFQSVSIYMILNGIALAGSDTGMVRALAGSRALGAFEDAWTSAKVTLLPGAVWSLVVAGALALAAPTIAGRISPDAPEDALPFMYWLVVALVFSGVGMASLQGTRSVASVKPFVLLYQVWLPTTRVLGITVLGVAGGSSSWMLAIWTVPLVMMDIYAAAFVVRRVRAERGRNDQPVTPPRAMFRQVWAFNLPRGLASFFEICIVWVDVLVVGYFLGTAAAGAYATASRFITSGTMAMEALRVGTSPMLATAFARGENARVQSVYALSTVWVVLLSWPIFVTLATFAPLIMATIGPEFVVASTSMTVMCLSILGYLALGNINSVLLMGGYSKLTASNTAMSLALNIALNFLLVPKIGMVGAAIAWAVAITFDSVLCVVRGNLRVGIHPPTRELLVAAGCVLFAFGVPGLTIRLFDWVSWPAVLGFVVVSMVFYALCLRTFKQALHLEDFTTLVRRRR